MKQITIYDIAKEAQVSGATVSRAISGKGYVSEKNKELIMKLVEKYNFRPNTFARSLKTGFTKTIGYIVPHIGNMYFANVYYEFERLASEHGYLTILLNSKGSYDLESKLLNSIMDKNVDGIVMMGGRVDEVNLSEKFINEIKDYSKRIPFVLCGTKADRFECTGVHSDDNKGIELLLTHLKDKGYKNICFMGGNDTFYPSFIKKNSAYRIGKKLGLEISVRWLTGHEVFTYEAGYRGMKILLDEKRLPDVICGINDYVAVGAMKAALEAGLMIPKDIAFTGFDDVDVCVNQPVSLTTINPNYAVYGKKVFYYLENLIKKKDMSAKKTTLIKPELKIREST